MQNVSLIMMFSFQGPSPTDQPVSPVPLEQTPAEEESRKSISRSFKGTMASSTERRFLFKSDFLTFSHFACLFCNGHFLVFPTSL